ncbi:MAG TPA: (d)CMP kinase [Chloroflexota bacterium]|nr:(d)CMP kinase [Chloroflexota bacterium]
MKAPVICMDGPAASGKTTIAKMLAERLGYFYLDTGVLYRAVTWVALQQGVSPSDGEKLAELASSIEIEVKPAPPGDVRQTIVLADGEDVSLAIRTAPVDAHVSEVSAHPAVRTALIGIQRSVAAKGGVILAGRDAGTVVWPESEVKLFLVASEQERARRRLEQARSQGIEVDFDTVLAELRRRDKYDSSRAVAPLKAATDAIVLDTTNLSIEQVVNEALRIVREKSGAGLDRRGIL